MRLAYLSILALAGACSFQPGGGNGGDDTDATVSPDACVPATETCEGTDQDCDGLIDEGFTSGAPCDGPDADVCLDDMTICNAAGAEVCGDTSGDDDVELCNGMDDDCDGNMDEGFMVGAGCDGEDGDACAEGTLSCAGDGLTAVCSDMTDTIVEVCDGGDDDCDVAIDEGFDLQGDEANCGECGNTCTNSLGTTMCLTGTCTPSCSVGAAECDGDPDNGCELQDTNPTCNPASLNPPVVNGDATDTEIFNGTTETFFRVRLRESQGVSDIDITARVALISGAGTDYDLYVYCPSCGATPLTDTDDAVEVGRADASGQDRGFDIWIEVRYNPATPSTTCAAWTVTVTGNVATANRCGGT
jgi:hypothetical protein